MNLTDEQIQLLHTGNRLACRTPARSGLKCWLSITPFKINPETGMSTLNAPSEPWQYRIRHFGIPNDFDYFNYDLHPEYVTNYANEVVHSIRHIENSVMLIINNLGDLDRSQNCDCPM